MTPYKDFELFWKKYLNEKVHVRQKLTNWIGKYISKDKCEKIREIEVKCFPVSRKSDVVCFIYFVCDGAGWAKIKMQKRGADPHDIRIGIAQLYSIDQTKI